MGRASQLTRFHRDWNLRVRACQSRILHVACRGAGVLCQITRGIEVHIRQSVTQDYTLATGDVTQQVTFTTASPLLQAEDAAVVKPLTQNPLTIFLWLGGTGRHSPISPLERRPLATVPPRALRFLPTGRTPLRTIIVGMGLTTTWNFTEDSERFRFRLQPLLCLHRMPFRSSSYRRET
jgi:hypothetical protein